jgi:glycosyltransferase involved in cell wall biosynthesis
MSGSPRLSRDFGHQIAISAGMDAARGDAIVVMDADLQDPPEIVGDMIARWKEGSTGASLRTGFWTGGVRRPVCGLGARLGAERRNALVHDRDVVRIDAAPAGHSIEQTRRGRLRHQKRPPNVAVVEQALEVADVAQIERVPIAREITRAVNFAAHVDERRSAPDSRRTRDSFRIGPASLSLAARTAFSGA